MRSIVAASLVSIASVAAAGGANEVDYPKGYRDWTHVKSMVIAPGHALFEAFGGIHHIYANAAAMTGYRRGRFPDGAVIAFDLLEATRADNAVVEGKRKVLGVMQKHRARFKETGGWGFEGFGGGDPAKPAVGVNAATACFACHAGQKERDFVFSAWRE